jgi:hypothetical protein
MTCAIMQPTFLPWLGYFDLIDQVNHFVFLDNVQLVKRSWQIRNRIKMQDSELFLTIPIIKEMHRNETYINKAMMLQGKQWKYNHLKSIEHSYKKSAYFDSVFPFVLDQYENRTDSLADFTISFISEISNKIGISTSFIRASEIPFIGGRKDVLLSSICKSIDCNQYLSPKGSAIYIESNSPGGELKKNDINLYYQNYEHPEYAQLNLPFSPNMCVLDLLFNKGFDNSLQVIRAGRRMPYFYTSYRSRFMSPNQILKCA